MSGSGDDEVRVTISADASGFVAPTKSATDAAAGLSTSLNKLAQTTVPDMAKRMAQAMLELGNNIKAVNPVWLETGVGAMRLSDAMKEAGNSLRSLTPEMLGMGSSTNALYTAVAKATEGLRTFAAMSDEDVAANKRMEASLAAAAAAAGKSVEVYRAEAAAIAQRRNAAEAAGQQMQQMASAFGVVARSADDGAASANRFVEALNPAKTAMLRTLFTGTAEEVEKLRASLVKVTTPVEDLVAKIGADKEAARVAAAEFQGLATAFTQSGASARAAGEDYGRFWRELGQTKSSQAALIAQMETLKAAESDAGRAARDSAGAYAAQMVALSRAASEAKVAGQSFESIIPRFGGVSEGLISASHAAQTFLDSLNATQMQAFSKALLENSTTAERMGASLIVTSQQGITLSASMQALVQSFRDSGLMAHQFILSLDPAALEQFRAETGTQSGGLLEMRQALVDAAAAADQLGVSFDAALLAIIKNRELVREVSVDLRTLAIDFARAGSSAKLAGENYTSFWAELDHTTSSQAALIAKMNELDGTAARNAAAIRAASVAAEHAASAVRMFGVELDKTARGSLQFNIGVKSAADSATFFAEQLDGLQTPLQKMKTLLGEDIPAAAGHSVTGVAGITRELFVLGHEAMSGRYTMIPGSLLTLAERAGGLMSALGNLATSFSTLQWVGVAAVGALSLVMVKFVADAFHAAEALNDVTAAAARMGRSTAEAAIDAEKMRDKLREAGVARNDIDEVVKSGAALAGVTREQRNELESLVPALRAAYRGDEVKSYWGALINAAKGGVSAVREYLREADLLNASLIAELDVAEKSGDRQKAVNILIREAHRETDGYASALAHQKEEQAQILAMGPAGESLAPAAIGPPKLLQNFEADDPKKVQDEESDQKLLGIGRERAAVETQIARLREKAASTSGAQRTDAEAELKVAETNLARMKEPGDASWLARVAEQAKEAGNIALSAAHDAHQKSAAMNEAATRAEVEVYRRALQEKGHLDKEYVELKGTYARLDSQLQSEEARGDEAAGRAGLKSARQALEEKLAALNEEQTKNQDNYATVMAIEQKKIDLLRASGATALKLLDEELRKEDELRHAHAQKMGEIAIEGLAKKRQADNAEFEQLKASLDEQLTLGKLSKAKELAELAAFYDQQKAMELQAMQALAATLPQESKAYQSLLDQMTTLKAQWLAKDQQMNAQILADHKATWDKMTAPVESAVTSQFGAVLRGTETIRQAEQKMAADVVMAYLEMGAKAALAWASSQAMQILWTGTGEAAKTNAVAVGAAARTGIGQAESAAQNTGLLARLARWIAMELGLTAATDTQSAARTASSAAADTAALSATGATNVAEGMSYAATGAAAAGASVAAIPVTGWSMAPAVAAETYAQLSGFASMASLAVGAYNLPSDMAANLHAGEMVIPASFAEGIRGAMGKGGGGSSQTLNYAPNVRGGGSDMTSTLRSQSAAFKSYIWHATRNGALSLPNGH